MREKRIPSVHLVAKGGGPNMAYFSKYWLSAALLATTASILQANGSRASDATGKLISPDEMGRCVGGECTYSYQIQTNCIVNQDPNHNPCPGTSTCAVNPQNAQKCVMYTVVTPQTPRCITGSSKKKKTDCVDQATGQNCATIFTGDVMNGSCASQCTNNKGGCGSGTYTTNVTPCTGE